MKKPKVRSVDGNTKLCLTVTVSYLWSPRFCCVTGELHV